MADINWTFVHYSDLPKLGINPKAPSSSASETPIGIYGWPETPDVPQTGRGDFVDRRYEITFNVKPEARDRIWTFGEGLQGSSLSVGEKYEQLRDSIFRASDSMSLVSRFEKYAYRASAEVHGEISDDADLYNAIRWTCMGLKKSSVLMTKVLRGAGFDGVVDWGTGTLFGDIEPAQGVFFHVRNLELIDIKDQFRSKEQDALRASSEIRSLLSKVGIQVDGKDIDIEINGKLGKVIIKWALNPQVQLSGFYEMNKELDPLIFTVSAHTAAGESYADDPAAGDSYAEDYDSTGEAISDAAWGVLQKRMVSPKVGMEWSDETESILKRLYKLGS